MLSILCLFDQASGCTQPAHRLKIEIHSVAPGGQDGGGHELESARSVHLFRVVCNEICCLAVATLRKVLRLWMFVRKHPSLHAPPPPRISSTRIFTGRPNPSILPRIICSKTHSVPPPSPRTTRCETDNERRVLFINVSVLLCLRFIISTLSPLHWYTQINN